MSEQYPDYHTHPSTTPGEKGQKGLTGDKGRPGINGHITDIVYAFEQRPPEDLNGPIIGKDWEKEGSPVHFLEVKPYQSVVYMANSSVWTYLPGCNVKGWKQTGYVNAQLYTQPGDKGDHGDIGFKGEAGVDGDKGDKGDRGVMGLPGRIAAKGDKGEKGFKGSTGDKGVHGVHGVRGFDGDKGDKGEKGERGLLGLKGPAGDDGTNGDKGNTGSNGKDGVVPNIGAVPVMMASYDGVNNLLGAKFNISSVVKVSTGVYRFRLDEKTRGGAQALTMVTIAVDDETGDVPNLLAVVGRQTDRVVTVAVRNLDDNTLADAHVIVVMFDPSAT